MRLYKTAIGLYIDLDKVVAAKIGNVHAAGQYPVLIWLEGVDDYFWAGLFDSEDEAKKYLVDFVMAWRDTDNEYY